VAAACILTLPATGKTYAFVPAFSSSDSSDTPDSVAEVTIATGTTIAGTSHLSAAKRTRYHRINLPATRQSRAFTTDGVGAVSPILTFSPGPSECGLDAAHNSLYFISNGSFYTPNNTVTVVSVNPTTAAMTLVTNFATDATTEWEYSGADFEISSILYDPKQSGIIISTDTGYEIYSGTSPYAKLKQINGYPAENFGYNSTTDQVFSPTYPEGSSGFPHDLGLVDLASGKYYQNDTDPSGLSDPDQGAVDSTTNVAIAPEEFQAGVYLVGLGSATLGGSIYTAPSSTLDISGPLVSSIVPQADFALTDVAVDSLTHLAFLTGEYGTYGFCVVAMPTTGTGTPTASDYACANYPAVGGTTPFDTPYDPHATSTFELGGKAYGLIFNSTNSYIAVIDLAAFIAATRDPADPHAVTTIPSGVLNYIEI
jgi:hypothetical protein